MQELRNPTSVAIALIKNNNSLPPISTTGLSRQCLARPHPHNNIPFTHSMYIHTTHRSGGAVFPVSTYLFHMHVTWFHLCERAVGVRTHDLRITPTQSRKRSRRACVAA